MELSPIPTLLDVDQYLAEAEILNPGPWVQHSFYVAQGARLIAERHPKLDPERAYILGCLHDIGRRYGVYGLRHVLDGFRFMKEEGYEGVARVCLTHAFPVKNVVAVAKVWDGSADELDFVRVSLSRMEYDEYDRIIQLCDALSLPTGFCLMEKRLVNVALRYGADENTVARWQGYFAVKDEIENAIGISVYSLLPCVVENTFGWNESKTIF